MLGQPQSLSRLCVFMSLLMVMAMALCLGQSQPPYGEIAQAIHAKVENYTTGEAELETELGGSYFLIGTGQIEADGSFSFFYKELEDIKTSEFTPITNLACEQVIPDHQESAQFILPVTIAVVHKGITVGEIVLYSREVLSPHLPIEVNDYIVTRMIVDKDVTIQGSCGDHPLKRDFDLQLKQGWNIVVWTALSVNSRGSMTAFCMETKPAPPDARWWFVKLPLDGLKNFFRTYANQTKPM